jgi:ribonuclease BN (tRNA processing enzyme)
MIPVDPRIYQYPIPGTEQGMFDLSRQTKKEKEKVQDVPLLTRKRRIHASHSDELVINRQWNSSSPLYSQNRRSSGGGYFLAWHGSGIVIDPGFGFVSLFDSDKHGIKDIDIVIVTHDHHDHCGDLPVILTLLRECNEGADAAHVHKVHFFVSYGVYFRYCFFFQNEEIRRCTTVDKVLAPAERDVRDVLPNADVRLAFTPTKHKEILGDNTGFGVRLELGSGGTGTRIGVTGDTGYTEELELGKHFSGVDLLIPHIGTLEDLTQHALLENHLGYRGIMAILKACAVPPRFALISEWGEEISGKREAVCASVRLHAAPTAVLPTEALMRLRLPSFDVYVDEKQYAAFDRVVVIEHPGMLEFHAGP